MSYANQKFITINRTLPEKNTKEPYLCIYNSTLETAAKLLNNTAFKLYICLVSNANNFKMEFSPQYVSNTYGISLTSARRALKELEEAGYIVEKSSSRYEFYDIPQVINKPIELKEERRIIQLKDGSKREFERKEFFDGLKDRYDYEYIKYKWNEGEVVRD